MPPVTHPAGVSIIHARGDSIGRAAGRVMPPAPELAA
jgi:hypothetical protein